MTARPPTPDLSPAGELRAAAKLIKERAGKATPGPWKAHGSGDELEGLPVDWYVISPVYGQVTTGVHEDPSVDAVVLVERDRADARYIAMMAPPVALAFAGLLEDAAGQYDDLDESPYPGAAAFVAGDFGGDPDPALVAARAVLAGDRP